MIKTQSHKFSWTWERISPPKPQPDAPPDSLLSSYRYNGQRPTVIFVHQFGGGRRTLARSIRLVHKFGLDAVWFPLLYNDIHFHLLPPFTSSGIGYGRVWANQISRVLKSIKGPKILFTHSMPSNSAMVALADNPSEVMCWICDGGPFLDLPRSTLNLFQKFYQIRGPRSYLLSAVSLAHYGPGFKNSLKDKIKALPEQFPVLSFRGKQDPLVSEHAIDRFLEPAKQINITKISFPDCGHLDLLKKHPQEYETHVASFLLSCFTSTAATPAPSSL